MITATGSKDEGDKEQSLKRHEPDFMFTIGDTTYVGEVKRSDFSRRARQILHYYYDFQPKDYVLRQKAVQEVAKADPNNIQEVAASQLSIINSYYQSGLQQSQQSFKWSLIWGGIGLGFLIGAISFLLLRQPTEVAIASGIGGGQG